MRWAIKLNSLPKRLSTTECSIDAQLRQPYWQLVPFMKIERTHRKLMLMSTEAVISTCTHCSKVNASSSGARTRRDVHNQSLPVWDKRAWHDVWRSFQAARSSRAENLHLTASPSLLKDLSFNQRIVRPSERLGFKHERRRVLVER